MWVKGAPDKDWAYAPSQFAQRGAFVLRPNYHGSRGYGLKWVESIGRGRYYDLEVPDIEKGVGALIARGPVDPERCDGDDPVFDLNGNAAEWVVAKNGKGLVKGGSAGLWIRRPPLRAPRPSTWVSASSTADRGGHFATAALTFGSTLFE